MHSEIPIFRRVRSMATVSGRPPSRKTHHFEVFFELALIVYSALHLCVCYL